MLSPLCHCVSYRCACLCMHASVIIVNVGVQLLDNVDILKDTCGIKTIDPP